MNDDIAYLGDKATPYLHASHVLGWLACAGAIVGRADDVPVLAFARSGMVAAPAFDLLSVAVLVFLVFAWRWHLLSPSVNF